MNLPIKKNPFFVRTVLSLALSAMPILAQAQNHTPGNGPGNSGIIPKLNSNDYSTNAASILKNDDGTWAISQPKFLLGSQNVRILSAGTSGPGLCKLFGFKKYISLVPKDMRLQDNLNNPSITTVSINKRGKYYNQQSQSLTPQVVSHDPTTTCSEYQQEEDITSRGECDKVSGSYDSDQQLCTYSVCVATEQTDNPDTTTDPVVTVIDQITCSGGDASN